MSYGAKLQDILRQSPDSRAERAFFTVGVFRRDGELGNFTWDVTVPTQPRSAKSPHRCSPYLPMQSPPFFIVLTAKSQPVQSAQTDMLHHAVPCCTSIRLQPSGLQTLDDLSTSEGKLLGTERAAVQKVSAQRCRLRWGKSILHHPT